MTTHFGKYRGTVVNNFDPLQIGRLQVMVPDVPGQTLSWAMPCVPYAGLYAMPAAGDSVWVEFERGDPDYPIWTGCFWSPGEVPVDAGAPHVKIFETDRARLQIDDSADSLILEIDTGNGLRRIELDPEGIRLDAGGTTLTLTAEGFDFNPPLRRKKR